MGREKDFCTTTLWLRFPSLSTVGQLFYANQKPRYARPGELDGDAQSSLPCSPPSFLPPCKAEVEGNGCLPLTTAGKDSPPRGGDSAVRCLRQSKCKELFPLINIIQNCPGLTSAWTESLQKHILLTLNLVHKAHSPWPDKRWALRASAIKKQY